MVFFEHYGLKEQESFKYFTLVNSNFPLHFHRAYEFIIVHEGELLVTINKKEYILRKNDLAFIFNNQLHELKMITQSNITILIFSPELIGHFFMNYKGYIPENNVLHLTHLPNIKGLDSIYQQKSFLYDICSKLVSKTNFIPVTHSPKTKVLYKILLYVDTNYMNDCTLKVVAKNLQYDYAYVSKLFVQMTNMTFTEYLMHYRVSQACYLLKNSENTISEIAMDCGFNNIRSFNRNFKKITKKSPRQYKESS
ncbi:AraC family transcriptional regulator [Niallia sp. FSL R7-0271]|uniref:AraC family transcriptional regulator n=1 Tax=Niallia sp. FSL R7-0271 TaxID=2921678 RepID=UPI0030F71AA6